MANRITSLLKGLGSVDAVAGAWHGELIGSPEIRADLTKLRESFALLMSDDAGRKSAMALVAAMLNESIQESNRVFSVTDAGKLDMTYHSSKADLELWASLIAGE